VTGAYLLADKAKTPLKVTKNGDGLDIALPEHKPDPIATVLVLRTA
jgi:alpha-L-fucosidase